MILLPAFRAAVSSLVLVSAAAGLHPHPTWLFGPLIPASCPQFPALNGPGVLCEDFDTNRNGAAGFQFTRLPIGVDPNDPLRLAGDPNDDVLGFTQGTGAGPEGVEGRTCSTGRGSAFLGCNAPQADENDWHLHSKFEGPGAGYDPRPGIGAPERGGAHSGFRSMHWGRHALQTSCCLGDTTIRFRQVAAFELEQEINIGPASRLEFWQMVSLPDDENEGQGFLPPGGTFGGGQVQISLLGADGRFERWRRLTPDFNGYDSIVNGTISICQFDPGDDLLPPNDDTMCDFTPLWSDLGDITGTDATCATDTNFNDPAHKDCGAITSCAGGPGCTKRGSIGNGVWARSGFDLSPFAGRQARLRWIGSMGGGWSYGVSRSFFEPAPGNLFYDLGDADDGWYFDDVVLTDLRQSPEACASDADGDGVALCDDCDDTDPAAWDLPGEAIDLVFAIDGRTLSWSPPSSGSAARSYDVLRAGPLRNFWVGTCVESNGADLTAVDPGQPSANNILYYLVRARNRCYGVPPLGYSSSGQRVDGRTCP